MHVLDSLSQSETQSLVLVDELATTTSSTDGVAIAWVVAEELIASKACTLFATHFVELTQLQHVYAPAFTSHMASEDRGSEYVLTHQCVPGPCTDTQYGLKMASKAEVPKPVVQHAMLLANKMRQQENLKFPTDSKVTHQAAVMQLLHTLLIEEVRDPDAANQRKDTGKLLEALVQHARHGAR
jgi:DNA mismatch repair protein MutS